MALLDCGERRNGARDDCWHRDAEERYGKGGAEDLIIVKPQTPGAQFFSISTK